MKAPTSMVLRKYRVSFTFRDNRKQRRNVAAQNPKQAERLVRAMYLVKSVDQIKPNGFVLAPFAA